MVNDETVLIDNEDLVQLDGPENMSVENNGDETLTLYVTISPAPPSEKYAIDVDM